MSKFIKLKDVVCYGNEDCSGCPFCNETEFGSMCYMQKHLAWDKTGNKRLKTVFKIQVSNNNKAVKHEV